MNEDQAKALRAPFPTEAIGKLPKVTCPNCSRDKQRKHCDQHQRSKCRVCDNYITSAHLHLDYVGHAELTDRLLQVDPDWTWEPVAFDQAGLPAMDRAGGLWIRLTVAGVTRLGYGAAAGKEGPDAVKEIIGDALRNAGMRFGIALDLWGAHGGAQESGDEEPAVGRGEPPQQRQQSRQVGPHPNELRQTIKGIAKAKGTTYEVLAGLYEQGTQRNLDIEGEAERIQGFITAIHDGRVPLPDRTPAGASS